MPQARRDAPLQQSKKRRQVRGRGSPCSLAPLSSLTPNIDANLSVTDSRPRDGTPPPGTEKPLQSVVPPRHLSNTPAYSTACVDPIWHKLLARTIKVQTTLFACGAQHIPRRTVVPRRHQRFLAVAPAAELLRAPTDRPQLSAKGPGASIATSATSAGNSPVFENGSGPSAFAGVLRHLFKRSFAAMPTKLAPSRRA